MKNICVVLLFAVCAFCDDLAKENAKLRRANEALLRALGEIEVGDGCLGGVATDERCGPNYGQQLCPEEYPYCNEANGWCGNTDAHKNAQSSEKYDYRMECDPAYQVEAEISCQDDLDWKDSKFGYGFYNCASMAKHQWCTGRGDYSEEARRACPLACGVCQPSLGDRAPSGQFFLVRGRCNVRGDCVSSEHYPAPYVIDSHCTISILQDAAVRAGNYMMIESSDHLMVPGPNGLINVRTPDQVPSLLKGGSMIEWTTDKSLSYGGWLLCFGPPAGKETHYFTENDPFTPQTGSCPLGYSLRVGQAGLAQTVMSQSDAVSYCKSHDCYTAGQQAGDNHVYISLYSVITYPSAGWNTCVKNTRADTYCVGKEDQMQCSYENCKSGTNVDKCAKTCCEYQFSCSFTDCYHCASFEVETGINTMRRVCDWDKTHNTCKLIDGFENFHRFNYHLLSTRDDFACINY